MPLKISCMLGSILEAKAEAIVNAANSLGYMGGGVAGAIKRSGGKEIEEEAVRSGPTPVGRAKATTAGRLPFRAVIHAPTMERPASRIPASNVGLAAAAALRTADELGLRSVAIPGLGTGVGGVSLVDASREMLDAVFSFRPRKLEEVLLVDTDPEMVAAWEREIAQRRHKALTTSQ